MAHRKGWSQRNELSGKDFFSTNKKPRTISKMLENKGYSTEKKQVYYSYEELFSEVIRNVELSEEEKNEILAQQGEALYQALVSCVKGFKTKITRDIILLPEEKELEILPTEGGEYDWKKHRLFMGSDIHNCLLDKYESTQRINLIKVVFSHEVEPKLIGPIIGNRLYDHALTPEQAEQVIALLEEEAMNKEDEKGELCNHILFIKCSNYQKGTGMRELEPAGSKSVMLVSCNIYYYSVPSTPPKKYAQCSAAMIGIVDGNNVEYCGINLSASRNGIFLLNSAIAKNDKVL